MISLGKVNVVESVVNLVYHTSLSTFLYLSTSVLQNLDIRNSEGRLAADYLVSDIKCKTVILQRAHGHRGMTIR
jgi:hypothetical protein